MRSPAVRSSRRVPLATLLLAAAFAVLSCSDESDIGPGKLASVRVTPDTVRVLLGRVDTARAFPLDKDQAFLPNKHITWETGDPAVATVNDSGIVTGNAIGTTTISATTGGITGTGTIVVDPAPTMVFQPATASITGIAGSSTPAIGADSVLNGGGGNVNGLVVDSITYPSGPTGWLSATLTGPATPVQVDLVANTSTLPLGTFQALVWFSSPDASPRDASLPVSLTTGPDLAASIVLQGGNNQTTTVNTAVATAPSVLVRDQFLNPVPGVSVTFTPVAGSGTVGSTNPITDINGIATPGSWTLGTTAGTQTLNATAVNLTGSPVVFTATGTADQAANLAINGGNNQAAVADSAVAVPPSARVTDQFGNPVAGVTVTFAVTSGGGQITGATPTSIGNGTATLGSWILGPVAGPNTLSATSGTLNGSPLTFTATGNPGNATDIALSSGNGQNGTVGTALGSPYVVLVTDDNGNPVQNVTVGWTATSGGGSMNPASSLTDVNGLASSSRTLGGTAGTQQATASVGGLNGSPVTFSATANPGQVATLTINSSNPQSATVNTAVASAPAVLARDNFLNPVPNAAVTFTVTAGGGAVNCGGGNVAACAVNTNGSGVATVTSWTVGTGAGTNNNTLSATRTGATGTSFTASATPGPVAFVSLVAGNGQTANRGTAVATDPSVLVRDAFLNVVPFATVNFAVIAGTAGLSVVNCTGVGTTGNCNVTASAGGIATVVSWTLGTIGTPSAGAPSGGSYTNVLRASSNGVLFDFSGFSVWSYQADVRPLIGTCDGCHFAGGQLPFQPENNWRNNLRNVLLIAPGACGGFTVYINGITNGAASSFVLNKLASAAPCRGSQMPQGGPFLNTTQLNVMRDWLNNASPDN